VGIYSNSKMFLKLPIKLLGSSFLVHLNLYSSQLFCQSRPCFHLDVILSFSSFFSISSIMPILVIRCRLYQLFCMQHHASIPVYLKIKLLSFASPQHSLTTDRYNWVVTCLQRLLNCVLRCTTIPKEDWLDVILFAMLQLTCSQEKL
jgi:hypothetical protein